MNKLIIALGLFACLTACGKKEEVKESVAVPPIAEASADQKMAAMLRGHPNSKQICVDGARSNAFFLDYGPLLPPGAEADNQFHGWLFIENVEFFKTSNDTWFITNQKDNAYIQVYPDTTGLICKGH